MSGKLSKGMERLVREGFDAGKAQSIIEFSERRVKELCEENSDDPKAVRLHTEQKIYVCIAYYEALLDSGMPGEDAEAFMDRSWSTLAEDEARSMRSLLKFPGLYRIYPRVYGYMARKLFGEKAGFKADFYDRGKHCCRFDMRKCLYYDVCTRYGHPELTKCFCHTDDVNLDGLHPKIGWERTQCMGCGGELCDFHVFVKEDESPR